MFRSVTGVCLGLAVTAAIQPAAAETVRSQGIGGIRLGAFTLLPSLEVGAEHDDNVFQEDVNRKDDYITYIRPRFAAQTNWSRHAMDFLVSSNIAFHNTYSSEDYEDTIAELGGRLDVLRDSFATMRFGFDKLHEERGSPDDRNGREPNDYRRFRGVLGYTHKFNRVSAGVEHNVQYYDYDDNRTDTFIINNDDRDRYHNVTSLRVGYEIQPGYEAFVRGAYHSVDYDDQFDDNGLQRTSEGYETSAGMAFDLTGLLTGDVFVGYREQQYDDPRLDTIEGVSGGVNLEWLPTQLTTVTASVKRTINETTLIGVSGYFSNAFDLRVDHELRRNIILTANAGYSRNDYDGNVPGFSEREEDILRAGFAATYSMNRYFYLKGSYDYYDRDVNIPGDDYTWNRFMVTVGSRI